MYFFSTMLMFILILQIAVVSSQGRVHRAQFAELQATVETLITAMYRMQSSNTALQSNVGRLMTANFALQSTVRRLESSSNDFQSTIDALQSSNTALQTNVGSLQTTVGTLQSKVSTLESSNADLRSTVDALQSSNNDSKAAMTALEMTVDGLEDALQSTSIDLKALLESSNNDSLSSVLALQSTVDTLQSSNTANQVTVQRLARIHDLVGISEPIGANVRVEEYCAEPGKLLACSVIGIEYTDGVEIDDGRCYVEHVLSSTEGVFQMKVTCGRDTDVGDIQYLNSSPFATDPVQNCPDGYAVISCALNTQNGTKYSGEIFPQAVISGNSCVAERTCRSDSLCIITAVCQNEIVPKLFT